MTSGVEALPDGAVLLHIGPYKTGTTAIQVSLHQHRADLAAHGVLYPGTSTRQRRRELGRRRADPARRQAGRYGVLAPDAARDREVERPARRA